MDLPAIRWHVPAKITPEAAQSLSGFPPLFQQILFNRGFKSREHALHYLQAEIDFDSNPYHMLGISEAVDRIRFALLKNETIAIYGDYDADGVTATALLVQALRQDGASVSGYIPDRFDEGYGLNIQALDKLKDAGAKLVITVDCGIRSPLEALHARQIGLDLIISDHHQPGDEIPEAVAVINPRQKHDRYPDKDLAGVGLAYKLACGLWGEETGHQYLDLVALGTIADLAPLRGENRYLVRQGMAQICQPLRQGVSSLIGVTGLTPSRVTAHNVGYQLGPRLNAAGRLDTALVALDLLLCNEAMLAGELAQRLDMQNRERQQVTQHVQQAAEEMALSADPEAQILIAIHPEFNRGVVGLAASKLVERYYRPAIVAQKMDEFTRGSCRSIPEFHITSALDECADLLDHHGGHAAAAGFTVRNEHLDELVERLKAIALRELGGKDIQPILNADVEAPLSLLHPEMLNYLELLQPTGMANPQATFISRNLKVRSLRQIGSELAHLKMSVTDGRIVYDAIAFRFGHWYEEMPERVDLLYTFEKNEYNGRESLQLNVRDIKPSW